MPTLLHEFIREVESGRKELSGDTKKSRQLQSQRRRDEIRALAEKYFGVIRPSILPANTKDPDVSKIDALFQQLVELCHRRGLAKGYFDLLGRIRGELVTLDSRIVSTGPLRSAQPAVSGLDQQITSTLDSIVASAANSYRQALADIEDVKRLSWRGPATDLRESLREVLDHFAPDAEVVKMQGYRAEPNTNGPTMKQKVRYILKLRDYTKAQSGSVESATDAVDESLGTFVRSVYTRSSLSTHTSTSRDEVLRVMNLVRVVLTELLEIRK